MATIDMGRKEGGCCAPFAESWDPPSYTMWPAEVYFRTKWHLHPSSRLATIDKLKTGGLCPFKGELQPHLTQRRLSRRLPPY